MIFDPEPVRVQQPDGSWVPVDTTLAVSGGRLVPAAAAVSLSFSDGGSSAPLATISRGSDSYSLLAPWTLPQPVVSGSTATYPSVEPGVDLVIDVLPDGFSDDLVVETAAAAQAMVAAPVTFGVSLSGLAQVRDPVSGSVRQVDASGAPVFSGDASMMFDSSGAGASVLDRVGTPAGAAAAVVDPSASAVYGSVDETVTPSSVSLAPSVAMLAQPGLAYPLVIDPVTHTQSIGGWTVLDREFHAHAYWDDTPSTSGDMSVGYDYYGTKSVRRSIVQFNTSALAGKHILGATFTAYDDYSSSCTAYEVDLYRTTSINSSTSWDKPPTWSSEVDHHSFAKGHSSSCPAGSQEFNATAAVVYTAGQSSSTTTLGMRATSGGESTQNDWKQFNPPGGSHPPKLSVTYLSKPSTPTSVRMSSPSLSCATSASTPAMIATTTPSLAATVSDADGSSASLRGNFQVLNGSSQVWAGNSSGWVASGARVTATTGALSPGIVYAFQVRNEYEWSFGGDSGSDFSAWSASCYFEIDLTAPSAPSVASAVYGQCSDPEDPGSCDADGGVGQPAAFTFTGDADVTSFLYTLNSGTQQSVAAVADGSSATASVQINPNLRDLNVLQVQARDGAGNTSVTGEYDFRVAPGTAPVGVWNLDDGTGVTLADANTRGGAHPATLAGGYTWSSLGRSGDSVLFDGSSGYAATSGPVVDTSKSFSVSAWVRLKSTAANSTFVSQSGVHENGFQLYYSTGFGWVFNRLSEDDSSRAIIRATDPAAQVETIVWTHLVGVYDSVAQTIQLYVNGVPGPVTAYTTPWNATGALQIGRHWADDAYAEYTNGQIDQVEIWDRILSPQEISDDDQLINPNTGSPTPAAARHWPVTESSGSTVADTAGYGHDLTLSAGGATLTSDAERGQVIGLDGASGCATDSALAVDGQGSFTATAWVDLSSAALGSGAQTAYVFAADGAHQATWSLSYQQSAGPDTGYWYFTRTSADATTATSTTVASDDPAQTDGWVMLSVVYDAPDGLMHLYINGIEQDGDGVAFADPWQSSSGFTLGRGMSTGSWSGYFPGSLDEISVWSGVTDQTTLLAQYASEVM